MDLVHGDEAYELVGYNGVIHQMLVAIDVVTLNKVMKLIMDFGMIQDFLMIPLQTSLVHYIIT